MELYRNNWYLVAWCHQAQAWRYFALERLSQIEPSAQLAAPGEPLPKLRGYGIFDLNAQHQAHLRFTPHRAQWVQDEIWHSAQQDQIASDGSLERRFPFGDPTELIRDLLREGPDVTVLSPEFLRQAVLQRHRASLPEAEPSNPDKKFHEFSSPSVRNCAVERL